MASDDNVTKSLVNNVNVNNVCSLHLFWIFWTLLFYFTNSCIVIANYFYCSVYSFNKLDISIEIPIFIQKNCIASYEYWGLSIKCQEMSFKHRICAISSQTIQLVTKMCSPFQYHSSGWWKLSVIFCSEIDFGDSRVLVQRPDIASRPNKLFYHMNQSNDTYS